MTSQLDKESANDRPTSSTRVTRAPIDSTAIPETVQKHETASRALPDGWRRVSVKEVADSIQYGYTASAVEGTSGPRFLRITDIQDGRVAWETVPSCDIRENDVSKYLLAPGDLVFARTGATTGKSFLIGECPEAVFASYLIRVRASGEVDSRYLAAFFHSSDYWSQIEGGKRGIGQPNVNATVLGQVQFPLPSLPEQRQIVAEIEKQVSRLDAGVAALRRVQANLKRYRAAVLKAACEGRLVPTESELAETNPISSRNETGAELLSRALIERRKHWRGPSKFQEAVSIESKGRPSLPRGWAWASPEELVDFHDTALCAGPFGTIFKAHDFRPAGVPIIFLRHVKPGRYLTHKPGFMDESKWHDMFRPYSVFGGELLVTKLGDPPGECAQYPVGIGPAMVTPDVIKLSVNSSVILPRFLMHYLNSDNARRFSNGFAFGTTRLRLTIPIFRRMPIPLPPLPEQTRIVAEVERRLSIIDDLEATVSANLNRASLLRQSILHKAFMGELLAQATTAPAPARRALVNQ